MAQRFDVPARLAEGLPAVDTTQTYVAACRRLGYTHPELTDHDRQLHDWYGTEDGMDLRVLDDDCALLRGALDVAEEALRIQRMQLTELSSAWRGRGAWAASYFLRHHCDTGAALTTALRQAALALQTLRDELWSRVDAKADAALRIDDRVAAQRPAWLLAARTVVFGGGDAAAAEDVVERQVQPYVVTDVGWDWLAAMRSAHEGVNAAYGAAASSVAPPSGLVFAVPGELRVSPGGAPADAAHVAQAGASAPASALKPVPDPALNPVTAVTSPPLGVTSGGGEPMSGSSLPPQRSWPADDVAAFPADWAAPLGNLGSPVGDPGVPWGESGMPLGAGLPLGGFAPGGAGIAPGIAEAVGRLFRRGADGVPEAPATTGVGDVDQTQAATEPEPATLADHTDPADAGKNADIQPVDDHGDTDDQDDFESENSDGDTGDTGEAGDKDNGDPGVDPMPAEVVEDSPVGSTQLDAPFPTAASAPATPCEIAADELPQVGR